MKADADLEKPQRAAKPLFHRIQEACASPVIGTWLALCAAFAFAGMGFCVRKTGGEVPASWVVCVRSAVGAILLTPFVVQNAGILRTRGAVTLWLRAFAGCTSSFFYFWNLQQSSVGDAGVLLNLSPVLVAILSWVFLKERLRKLQIGGIVVSLLGLCAVGLDKDSRLTYLVFFSGFCGATLSAIAFTALRRAASRFSTTLVVWTYMVVGLGLTLVAGGRPLIAWVLTPLSDGTFSTPLLWAIGSGLCGLVGQLFFTLAFLSLEAAVATTLSLTSVLWGTLLEIWLDDRVLGPSTWIAYAVVLSGTAIVQWSTVGSARRKRKRAALAPPDGV